MGDFVDRGPRCVDVLSMAHNMVRDSHAMCVPGNHDVKLLRWLRGASVRVKYGLQQSIDDIESMPEAQRALFKETMAQFIDSMVSHYVLDDGRLVIAHAGMQQAYQGRSSGRVREYALYGETTGEKDALGLPIRIDWASKYRGDAMVVYGHTPVLRPRRVNNTVNIDTGCVFGGKLTAFRYPEQELVSVPAARTYYDPPRPLRDESDERRDCGVLDADDVIGKRVVSTRLRSKITVRQENAMAALQIISRFAIDPKWLVYLPPTMSPPDSSRRAGYLEHPQQAFDYYRSAGVQHVVCQEKHMGSRAVVVVGKNSEAIRDRFGVQTGESGIVYSRTGRRFFDDLSVEQAIVERLANALSASDFWQRLNTQWAVLDCELMPWSAKAISLLKNQYAALSAAARGVLPVVQHHLSEFLNRQNTSEIHQDDLDTASKTLRRMQATRDNVDKFQTAYRHYCWNVDSMDDFRLAPFHILATESKCHVEKNHHWHMSEIQRFCDEDSSFLMATNHR
ncbi:MAG: metallophosphoesterase, partial [Planctomycetota bacterium]